MRIDILSVRTTAPAIALLLAACGGEPNPPEDSGADPPTSTAESTPQGGRSCIADRADKPCQLLTEALVRELLPDAPPALEQNSRSGSRAACAYSWESGRTRDMDIGGRSMQIPVDNSISLSWIESYQRNPEDQFRRAYLPTAEEMARARKILAEQFDKQAEKQGLSEEQKAMGEAMAEGAMERSSAARAVEGLGTMAATSGNDLYVLHGDTKFQISVDISPDAARNQEVAIAVAERLLARCD